MPFLATWEPRGELLGDNLAATNVGFLVIQLKKIIQDDKTPINYKMKAAELLMSCIDIRKAVSYAAGGRRAANTEAQRATRIFQKIPITKELSALINKLDRDKIPDTDKKELPDAITSADPR